jgi:hypothetical protein
MRAIVDVTRNIGSAVPIGRFRQEEQISPDLIGEYKTATHQAFIRDWLVAKGKDQAESFDQTGKSARNVSRMSE